jgi:hypothetical protein
MKKKLIPVQIDLKDGQREFQISQIVSLRYDKESHEETELKSVIDACVAWAGKCYPDVLVVKVTPFPMIYAEISGYGSSSSTPEDGYSADLSIDRIEQLIEETKPYTDRLALNGWAPIKTIEHFQKVGHYVNTIQDADNTDNYTIIKWG